MANFGVGDRVAQPTYGLGTVTSANDRHTVIDFDAHGVRTFVTAMVTLERSSEPAPPRAKRSARRKAVAQP
jgi:phosphoglycolate phosphatase-like HAD superfamily hydrolase